jgi:RNA polymerase sigma factor (TIGR02999 family)
MAERPVELTQLLRAHAAGQPDALDQLLPRIYGELRGIARARLRRERADHTLAPTEVVNEAFLKLLPLDGVDWKSRAHFFAIASRAMRNVLVDHAVRRKAQKRGGGARAAPLEELESTSELPLDELVALGDALSRLEQLDARQARVVECRFFGGLSLDETAEALGISPATVSRDWTFARAWLHRALAAPAPDLPSS